MVATKYFSQDELEELGIPYDEVPGSVEILDQRRWYNVKRGVFEIDGKHYAIKWNEPATELQEGQNIWNEDPVLAVEVEEREVTVKKWVPVD